MTTEVSFLCIPKEFEYLVMVEDLSARRAAVIECGLRPYFQKMPADGIASYNAEKFWKCFYRNPCACGVDAGGFFIWIRVLLRSD